MKRGCLKFEFETAPILRVDLQLAFDEKIEGNAEDLGKSPKLNIGDEPFPTFDPLNGVFIDVDADQLHLIGKPSLRKLAWIA